MKPFLFKWAGCAVAALTLSICPGIASGQNKIVMIQDFTNGVAWHLTNLQPATWTPAQVQNGSTAVAASFNGNPCMKISDNGGVNGIYAIFPDAVPADGQYTLRCTAKFYEFKTATNYTPFKNYQIMLKLDGAHRSGTGTLATPPIKSPVIASQFTDNDDSAKPPITLQTEVFDALLNQDLCISFSTWDTFGTFYTNGNWNGSYILIDNIELVPYPEPEPETPVSLSGWELE